MVKIDYHTHARTHALAHTKARWRTSSLISYYHVIKTLKAYFYMKRSFISHRILDGMMIRTDT